MKEKSFKNSFKKMYMVPPELYNRLLNIADTKERRQIQKENGEEPTEATVPSPFDELKAKLSEVEQKLNLFTQGKQQDQQQQEEETKEPSVTTAETSTQANKPETADVFSQTFPYKPKGAQISTQTDEKKVLDKTIQTETQMDTNVPKQEISTQTEHSHIGDQKLPIAPQKSKHIHYASASKSPKKPPQWRILLEKRKAQLDKVKNEKKKAEEELKKLAELQEKEKEKRKKKEISKSVFKCKICNALHSSSQALKEHYNTKHNVVNTRATTKRKQEEPKPRTKKFKEW